MKGWTCAALAGAAAICALAVDNRAVLRSYRMKTARLKAGASLRLAYLSDLHSEPQRFRRERILRLIKEARPDILLLGGDILDGWRADGETYGFLRRLSAIAPVYAAMGNHECRNRRLYEMRAGMRDCGVHLLCDEYRLVPGAGNQPAFWIGGMEDMAAPQFYGPYHWAARLKETMAPLAAKEGVRILLSHRPLPSVYFGLPVDLILSGHAHGGQVRLPGVPGGLYTPDEGFLPRYAGGAYRYNGKLHIVGRGASCFFFPPRVNNPPEVVSIQLDGKG
ncbi:MAG: hypothetical protein HFG26_02395 [Provencibacterium sp.]|nr:hypothetical protein [Provencibacterium sp.]